MRRPAPPPPTDPLDRLLRRLRERPELDLMDPALPGRVEEAIRRGERGKPPARVLPLWAVVAAVVLSALGAGGVVPHRAAPAGAALAPVTRPVAPPLPNAGGEPEPADEEGGP